MQKCIQYTLSNIRLNNRLFSICKIFISYFSSYLYCIFLLCNNIQHCIFNAVDLYKPYNIFIAHIFLHLKKNNKQIIARCIYLIVLTFAKHFFYSLNKKVQFKPKAYFYLVDRIICFLHLVIKYFVSCFVKNFYCNIRRTKQCLHLTI